MLTMLKEIFTWWNQQTLGTRIQIFFFGKLVGKDHLGNKYYQSKSGKRWVIYNGEIEASKISNFPSSLFSKFDNSASLTLSR